MQGEMKSNTNTVSLEGQVKSAQGILQKSAEYIAATQPQLDKQAAFEERFMKRAAEVAGVLVDRGIIPSGESDQLLQKLAEDKTRALDLVARLARIIGPDTLGKSAEVFTKAGQALGPFEALALNDDPSKTQVDSPLVLG